uniref:Ribosomal_L7Ae domain-containing protein n=1 Tax=Strongyloides papillosus TaxID=174720 RepID=A0A0N5CC60_STREA
MNSKQAQLWNFNIKFDFPISNKFWRCYYFNLEWEDRICIDGIHRFIKKLRTSPKRLNMCDYSSYEVTVLESDENKIKRKFLKLQENNATFGLFIISEKKKKLHGVIKKIGKECGIPTQIICHKSIEAVLEKGKVNILFNILLHIDEICGFNAFF